jgi:hypothetical protein
MCIGAEGENYQARQSVDLGGTAELKFGPHAPAFQGWCGVRLDDVAGEVRVETTGAGDFGGAELFEGPGAVVAGVGGSASVVAMRRDRAVLQEAVDALSSELTHFDGNRDEYVSDAQLLNYFRTELLGGEEVMTILWRDRLMADLIRGYLKSFPDAKVVIFAHDLHLIRAVSTVDFPVAPAGVFLGSELGESYRVILGVTDRGGPIKAAGDPTSFERDLKERAGADHAALLARRWTRPVGIRAGNTEEKIPTADIPANAYDYVLWVP